MLVPVFQKAKASETVSPLRRNLEVSALIKEVGLSCRQLYPKAICEFQRLCVDFAGIDRTQSTLLSLPHLLREDRGFSENDAPEASNNLCYSSGVS
jgi:hypothetical protein